MKSVDESFVVGLIKSALNNILTINGMTVSAFYGYPQLSDELAVNLTDDETGEERLFAVKIIDCDKETK
jgi:hypothetical protein